MRTRTALFAVIAMLATLIPATPLLAQEVPPTDLKINEVDYDQDGTDAAEFVELYNSGSSAVDLSFYELVGVNGSNDTEYETFALSGTLDPGSFYVVCGDSANTPNCDLDSTTNTNLIQNGAPDGLVLRLVAGSVVVDSMSYEGDMSGVTETTSAPTDNPNTDFAGLSRNPDGADTNDNSADFAFVCVTPGAANTADPDTTECTDPTPAPPPPPECVEYTIPEIQGAQHTSPVVGDDVCTTGIVTAVDDGTGYYLQDPDGDDDIATSDAVFVFDRDTVVALGDEVTVDGSVSEFTPGGAATRNLSTTQISANSAEVNSSSNPLPDPIVIGAGGRILPNVVIEDDAFGSFDPETDGLDFFESLEAMRVTVAEPTAVAGTTRFGEITTLPKGVTPTQMSQRGTLNISPSDFNPERVQIDPDSGVFAISAPTVDTGAQLSDVTGVVGYSFGSFEVIPTETFTVTRESRLRQERTSLKPVGIHLTAASYNVLNLDPNDGDGDTDVADGRFSSIAEDIVYNLRSPDIVALQEIQDNSGSDDDEETAADETLQLLVDEIVAAGGPHYRFIDNPFIGDNTSGGQPGANIRVAFLFNPDRVESIGAPMPVVDPSDQQTNPDNPFWDTRPSLVQKFEFRDREVTVVNNHFASKSGSAPLYGTAQNSTERQEDETVNGSLDERRDQAVAVASFIDPLLDDGASVIALGDFNEFEFISPLETLDDRLTNLTFRESEDERYTFIFDGNSQSLDHILVSNNLSSRAKFDIVHLNAEYAATSARSSDHDPLVTSINMARVARKASPAYSLYVLHNNDGESDLLPDSDGSGSISRFGELLEDESASLNKGRTQGAIAVTSGDNFLASPEFSASLDKGVPFYDSIALDRLPYDAYVIGNHEFDFGPEVLADFIDGFANCSDDPFLTANLIFDAEPSLASLVDDGCIAASTVVERDRKEIGIIGLTTPDLREVSSPGDTEILENLAELANEEASRLTRQGVDFIIVASHLQDIDNEVALAGELSNVDAIIGGGGGEGLFAPLTATNADGTLIPIVTVPGDYFDLGRLQLDFDRRGNLIGFDWDLLRVDGNLDQDQYLLDNVEAPVADFVAELDLTVVATSPVGLNGVRAEVRTRETNLGNLMTDGYIDVADARGAEFGLSLSGPIVGLQNGGGIRNDSIIGPGDITLLDTFDIAPFTNFVSAIEDLAPADLIAAVEHGLSGLPNAAGSFGQWSGLVVSYDESAPAGSRIVDLTVNGTPFVSSGVVQGGLPAVDLITIDFLAAGNDGYDMFETYSFTRLGTSYQQSLELVLGAADLTDPDYQENPGQRIIPIP